MPTVSSLRPATSRIRRMFPPLLAICLPRSAMIYSRVRRDLVCIFSTVGALLGVVPGPLAAQATAGEPMSVTHEVFAGSEVEGYLRALQNVGTIGEYPWSIRAFSPGEVDALGVPEETPWGERYRFGLAGYGLTRPRLDAVYNSAFPFGGNDGPIWAGRGVTGAIRVGGYLRYGPVSLVVAPVVFWAQNQAFPLAPIPDPGDNPYRSPLSPNNIDLPQRFGEGAYSRVDAGYSTLRLGAGGVTLGFSTAPQQWGPSDRHPLVLGPNAGGFPHAFMGTERPVNIGIGKLHVRYMAGRLEQSEWAPASDLASSRSAVGLVFALMPRGLAGLELGMIRFIHREWPEGGPGSSELFQPFEALFKKSIPDAVTRFADNQLLSAFARWNVPSAGFEAFGEFVRIDHAVDSRVLAEEPDDLSGYALGVGRVWEGRGSGTRGGTRLTVLRAEVLSTVSSHRQRGGARLEYAQVARHMYRHGGITEGHTHRGQLLVSPEGHGGQVATVGVDRFDSGGGWSLDLQRSVERDRTVGMVEEGAAPADVSYVLGGSVVRFFTRMDFRAGLAGVYDMNRNLEGHRLNFNLQLGAAAHLP